MTASQQPPGLQNQAGVRTFLRVGGAVFLLAGVIFLMIGILDFFAAFNSFEGPTKFWTLFLAMPLLFVGSALSMYGWMGAGARYGAGESVPVVKDSVSYLTDGEGLLGVGRTVDDVRADATGPFCRACGTRNDATAKFCDSCGQSLA